MNGAILESADTLAEGRAGELIDTPGFGFTPEVQGATVKECCSRSWTAVDAVVIGFRCDADFTLGLGAERHRLLIVLDVIGGRFSITDGSASAPPPRANNVLSLVPRRAAVRGLCHGARLLRLFVLDFDEGAVEQMIDGPGPWAQRLMFADTRLRQLALLLADECASAQPTSRLYADALSLAMIQRLVDFKERSAPPERGGLPPFKLRQVTEYMHAHLGDEIGLQELAGVVGISPSYFRRAFKSATGLPPHQWLILARCERAKFLLMQNRSSLAEVALEVGFYDQAHFTRLFTQHIGVSPGLWRRSTTEGTGPLAQQVSAT